MKTTLPDPASAPDLFDGILTRRVLAYLVDVVIIGALALVFMLANIVAGFLTLGLAWLTLPIIVPVAVFLYYVITLGSARRATVGMQVFDIVLTPVNGPPLDGLKALIHPFVFWVTIWIFWPLLFIGLFTQRRQLLHDMITGTLMVRHSPMDRHWKNFGDIDGAAA